MMKRTIEEIFKNFIEEFNNDEVIYSDMYRDAYDHIIKIEFNTKKGHELEILPSYCSIDDIERIYSNTKLFGKNSKIKIEDNKYYMIYYNTCGDIVDKYQFYLESFEINRETNNIVTILINKIKEFNYKVHIQEDSKIKYGLEFEDKIGKYTLHSDKFIAEVNLFSPHVIYENSRIVKKLIEDQESYIESYNRDEGYIIIRNDTMNKFVNLTSKDGYHFYYIEPSEFCRDTDRI